MAALVSDLIRFDWFAHSHVGVYWRGGALLPGTTEPGYHFKLPFVDTYSPVQISVQVRYL